MRTSSMWISIGTGLTSSTFASLCVAQIENAMLATYIGNKALDILSPFFFGLLLSITYTKVDIHDPNPMH